MKNIYNDMILQGDNILVRELQDDLLVNGVVSMYDSDNPYMFCELLNISNEAKNHLEIDDISNIVVVIKRYAKEEYIGDTYFISYKDIRALINKESYNSLIS